MLMTFLQLIHIFNIFVGLYLAATFMVFFVGLGVYFTRLGTWPSSRDQAIVILEWAVSMLFVLIVLLALIRFFELHLALGLTILALIIIVVVGVFVLRTAAGGGGEEEPKKKH